MKIISLNIEKDKHFEKHKDFFLNEQAEIICLQEVFEEDIEKYKKLLKINYHYFSPMGYHKSFTKSSKMKTQGIAILSKYKFKISKSYNIFEKQKNKSTPIWPIDLSESNKVHWKLIFVNIFINNKNYNIYTTHAPVTHHGDFISDLQREYFKNLKTILGCKKSLILTGDFNNPRGSELFDDLSKIYTDNIPKKYMTSIDNKIHRAGHKNLQYIVDGFFTTKDVKVKKIRYQDKVSDHFAVIAEVN